MTTFAGYSATIKRLSNGYLRALDVHKIAQVFDPLEGVELDALRASVSAVYDESQPIVCWAATGEIVDGRNRRNAAVGGHCRDVPVAYVDFPDEAAIIEYVRAQNLTRRHMTDEKRAEAAAKLVNGGMSTRLAAKATGVSQKTAQRAAVKARSGESDDSPAAERTIGADGKSYPATKPKANAERRESGQARLSALDIVEHMEQATERLRELADDEALTSAAVRKIDAAAVRFARAVDFARDTLGDSSE